MVAQSSLVVYVFHEFMVCAPIDDQQYEVEEGEPAHDDNGDVVAGGMLFLRHVADQVCTEATECNN